MNLSLNLEYFNKEGFSRWNKIYSESGEVNGVQLDIREGHQQTIDKVINWLGSESNNGKTLCDAGCGVGSLAIPLSTQFKKVFASDISAAMTTEAANRAKQVNVKNIEFTVSDMEQLKGSYDTVSCIDVMIHYPTDKVSLELFLHRCASTKIPNIKSLLRCMESSKNWPR